MTSKLALYNKALSSKLGERPLASLSENVPSRYALDAVWDAGFVRQCLAKGLWRFARRTISLTHSPSVEPDFGPRFAFQHPDDYVRTAELCDDEYMRCPLREYRIEAGHWYADVEPIFVVYISDDVQYGNDMALWTPGFIEWVATFLAKESAIRIKGNDWAGFAALVKLEKRELMDARSTDAMEESTKMATHGTWVEARAGRYQPRGPRTDLATY